MSKEMWNSVKRFEDGESLNAEVLNIPIGQLGDRTDYLYNRIIDLISGGKMSAVVLTDVELSTSTGAEPVVGNVVYLDNETRRFAKAKATMSLYDDFTADNSAFVVGILQRKDGNFGDVIVYGKMSLVHGSEGGGHIPVSSIIEDGEEFRSGRYYLSANDAGHLTAHPNGPLIYVCSINGEVSPNGAFESGSAMLNPQFLDIGTSHVHRTATLTARPAGTLSTRGYLPIAYDSDHPENALAMRFGGTWTSKSEATYEFGFNNETGNWAGGLQLAWKEYSNGKIKSGTATIVAPDIPVPISSNGLTVSVSFPNSNPSRAFDIASADGRSWKPFVLPEAGKGWLDHMPYSIASLESPSEEEPNPHVAVRGRLDASPSTINVYFPKNVQYLALKSSIVDGDTFMYGGVTYEFTNDSESYSGTNTSVDIGVDTEDTALYLAKALNKTESGIFAVHKSASGVVLVAMDAQTIGTSDGTIIDSRSEDGNLPDSYGVIGATNPINMVVYDGESRILGSESLVTGVVPYVWSGIGNGLSVMVFQDVHPTDYAVIYAKSLMSCTMEDYEPDALYDYSIGFEPAIANYWPPVPPKSAALIVNGVEMDNKALLPNNPTVSFGRTTIHWFTDAEGRKPWPEDFVNRNDLIDPARDKTEVMHWVRGFQGSTGPVTSLQAREGSPFRVVGYGTNESANVGDLEIVGDFDFEMVNGGAPGYIVPKKARNGRLIGGAVVERVVGGAGIAVIPQAGSPDGQGTVVLALDDGAYHSQFSDVALENAEQAKIGMFPYIRLKGYVNTITSPSAFTAMMRVPINLPDGKYSLRMQAAVFGENGFTGASKRYASVKLAYNILPDFRTAEGMEYRDLKTSLLKPNAERVIDIPFGHEASGGIVYNGFDPILIRTADGLAADKDDIVSSAFGDAIPSVSEFIGQQGVDPALRPGYLVGIRISRIVTSGNMTAYTSPIGFINLSWSLVSIDGSAGYLPGDDDTSEAIRELQREVNTKVSKTALQGVDVYTNTTSGIREAVKDISGVVGANVVK